jgi:hypothetical protein
MSTTETKERAPMTHEERQAALARIRAMLDEDDMLDEAPASPALLRLAAAILILTAALSVVVLIRVPPSDWSLFGIGLVVGAALGSILAYLIFAPAPRRGG